MKDKVGISFTDQSDREKGYRVNIDNLLVGGVEIDEPNAQFVESGDVELLSKDNNTPIPSVTGEDYLIRANDTGRGTKQIQLINFNQSGSTTASLGAIDVFHRANLYLYIGDEEVLGTGNLSDLHLYEGESVETLEELMQDSFVKTSSLAQPQINSDWEEAQASEYSYNNKFGAEVSFIDDMTKNYKKPIAIWRLAVPNAIASTNYASGGNALQYIQDNISQHILQLRDKFTQARLSGVVINMDNRDSDVLSSYQAIIDWLRSFFDFEDLPIVLTDRRGVRQEIKDTAHFKIEDRGDVIGDWYEARGMTGYYGAAQPSPYELGIEWQKLYELDGTEHTGNHRIMYNAGDFDPVVQQFALQNAEFSTWRQREYYDRQSRWLLRQRPPENLLAGGQGIFSDYPQSFMYIEHGNGIYKSFEEWMQFLKISTYDEWNEKFAGTGLSMDYLYTGRPHVAGTSQTVLGYYFEIPHRRPELFTDPLKSIVAKSTQLIYPNSDVVEIVPYGRSARIYGKKR